MIYQLDDKVISFPDPREGESNGWFAVGGDLSVERLWLAYHNGMFPWYAYKQRLDKFYPCLKGKSQIQWYCPMDRFVIFPNEIHISHSMRTMFNKGAYKISVNQAFDSVIENCSKVDGRIDERYAWLGPDMIKAYKRLFELKRCLSVEVWNQEEKLVGGLYGVLTEHVFCGESMFSLEPNTSKMALIYLCKILMDNDVKMIDCQFETQHLKSMGGRHISYEEYMRIMRGA